MKKNLVYKVSRENNYEKIEDFFDRIKNLMYVMKYNWELRTKSGTKRYISSYDSPPKKRVFKYCKRKRSNDCSNSQPSKMVFKSFLLFGFVDQHPHYCWIQI